MSDFMKLRELEAARKPDPALDLEIDEAEMCDRYARTYTGAINDVLREHLLMDQALPHDIRPLLPDRTIAGVAFTIRSATDPSVDLDGEMQQRAQLLESIPRNAICVWDTNREDVASHWGGMMTASVKKRGVRGAIVDGGIRDTAQILGEDFQVFYRYRSSNGLLGRSSIVAHQVPITLGGVHVFPGDVIVADIDGAIVVPRRIARTVLERTEAIMAFETDIKIWVDSGESPTSIVRKGGYF